MDESDMRPPSYFENSNMVLPSVGGGAPYPNNSGLNPDLNQESLNSERNTSDEVKTDADFDSLAKRFQQLKDNHK